MADVGYFHLDTSQDEQCTMHKGKLRKERGKGQQLDHMYELHTSGVIVSRPPGFWWSPSYVQYSARLQSGI